MVPAPGPAARVHDVLAPVVRAAGLFLEDVEVAPAGRRTVVRVVIDLDDAVGSLDLDTVGEVSRAISDALDAAEPVRGAYTLEVTTPGTDRPLTTLRHFRRARTRLVTLTLTDGTTLHGRLTDADADGYTVEVPAAGKTPARTAVVTPDRVVRGRVDVELNRIEEES